MATTARVGDMGSYLEALGTVTPRRRHSDREIDRIRRAARIDSDHAVAQAELNLKTAETAAINLGIAHY